MDLSVDRESRFVRKNEKKENKCPLKNKMYFELNRMMVFFNYVFNWLFGLSFHKYHEEDFLFMQYGCVYLSIVLSGFFPSLYSLP